MNIKGIDTAAAITEKAAQTLYSEGYRFAGRYLVPASGDTAWKALTAEEAKRIRDAGLAILPVWETTASRAKAGAEAGEADGRRARQLAQGMSIPVKTTIYFAVDYNAPAEDMGAVKEYFAAAAKAVSPYGCGVYGSYNVVDALELPKWQCVAWSGGRIHKDATVYQWQGQQGVEAMALKQKVGFSVDLNKAATLAGMWQPETEYADGDGTITEYTNLKPNTETPAVRWMRQQGFSHDSAHSDVTWEELCAVEYAFHGPSDEKRESGLLT